MLRPLTGRLLSSVWRALSGPIFKSHMFNSLLDTWSLKLWPFPAKNQWTSDHSRWVHYRVSKCWTVTPLTRILLTWSIRWAPNNASKWQIGFNSAFKRLTYGFDLGGIGFNFRHYRIFVFLQSIPTVGLNHPTSNGHRDQFSVGEQS
jgi:hypothetical protein